MVKTEYLNDGTLVRHYSDAGYMLLQVETGMKYADPIDLVPCRYTYEETDELVVIEADNDEADSEANSEVNFEEENPAEDEELTAEEVLAELMEVLA